MTPSSDYKIDEDDLEIVVRVPSVTIGELKRRELTGALGLKYKQAKVNICDEIDMTLDVLCDSSIITPDSKLVNTMDESFFNDNGEPTPRKQMVGKSGKSITTNLKENLIKRDV